MRSLIPLLILVFASRADASGPLLRVSASGYSLVPPVQTHGFEMVVYRDRLTIEDAYVNGQHRLTRASAAADAFQALVQAIGEAQTGTAASCEFGDPRLDRGRSITYHITWFGRPPRVRSFKVVHTFDAGHDQCPFPIRALVSALRAYSSTLPSAADSTTVSYSPVP